MINFTDVNPTLFASDGQFFYGKLVFLSPGTTDPKQVYDKDGVVYASNVVTTDTKGRMAIQVFLDGAYDVQFWKFVGTQFDIDDPTQWAFDREMRVLDPTKLTLEISGDAIVGTIEDLRGVDNAAEGATMTVMGYYAAGDMTPQYYYWNPNAADTDDGGSVICPDGHTGTGRWFMIPQRVVDVRAFGVEPSQQSKTATVTGNMAAAFNFANRYNRDLWFPKVYSAALYSQQVYSYYKFNGGNLTLANNKLLVDNCVLFRGEGGTTTTISVRDVEKKDRLFPSAASGSFVLNSDSVHSAWGEIAVTYNPRKRFIADAQAVTTDTLNLSDVEVILEFPDYGYNGLKGLNFTNCVFTMAGGSLALPNSSVGPGHSFTNCLFTDRFYSRASNNKDPLWHKMLYGKLRISSCEIGAVTEFENPTNFLYACVKNGITDIDLCGRNLPSKGLSLSFDKIPGDFTIRNAHSSFSWDAIFSGNLSFFGNVFGSSPFGSKVSYARFSDCTFGQSNLELEAQQANMNGCFVGCKVNADVLIAEGNRFSNDVTVRSNSELIGNIFSNIVTANATVGTLTIHVTDNRFGNGLKLGLETGETFQCLGCRFIGNYFERDGIYVDSKVALADIQTYVYKGNSGSANPTKQTKISPLCPEMNDCLELHNQANVGKLKVNIAGDNVVPDFELFAIGDKTFEIEVKGTVFYFNDDYPRDQQYSNYEFVGYRKVKAEGKRGNFTFSGISAIAFITTAFDQQNMPSIGGGTSVGNKFFACPSLEPYWIHDYDWVFEIKGLDNA